jgi:hypothetical protein
MCRATDRFGTISSEDSVITFADWKVHRVMNE